MSVDLKDIELFKNDLPEDVILEGDLAIDTETMGLNLHRDRLCLVQISDTTGRIFLIQFDPKSNYNAPNLKKFLLNEKIVKIFHFARFDVAMLNKHFGIEMKNIFCTKIASKLSRTYTDYHGLKDLCRELIAVNISKAQQSSNWGAVELTDLQKIYAANDVVYLHSIRDKLTEYLDSLGRLDVAEACFGFINMRAKLDLIGWNDKDIFAHH
ncbi:MAG TPA: ribonuclease H-like domain-containing protein [Candidatus Megaira endosymbiont of Hartmannula sinica]|nr:ribonuclease H-like domain-containing protein [Candidatus Megaera endosymbiont of Hartmannula sinica]